MSDKVGRVDTPVYAIPLRKPSAKGVRPPKRGELTPLTRKGKGMLTPLPYLIKKDIIKVSACTHQNAAIDRDHNLWLWGADKMAKHREGWSSFDIPQAVSYSPRLKLEGVIAAAVGALHGLCVTLDGKVWSWGDNQHGQLGVGTEGGSSELEFVCEGGAEVYANEYQSFVIKKDKSLWGWGDNDPLGRDAHRHKIFPCEAPICPAPMKLMEDVVCVASDTQVCMAVNTSGELWAWGFNKAGLIFSQGMGPCAPTLLMEAVAAVSMPPGHGGGYFCLVLMKNGDLYSLGTSSPGAMVSWRIRTQYGHAPVKVLEHVAAIKAGNCFSQILLKDGSLYGTGLNDLGQCGLGTSTAPIYKPRLAMHDVLDMAAGYVHGMGLQTNGDLWIWGGDYGIGSEEPDRRQQTLDALLGGEYSGFFK